MKVNHSYLLLTTLITLQVYADSPMVDPTKPPADVMAFMPNAEAQVETPWQLTAVQHNATGGFAVVNGDFVQFGASYKGFKLVKLTEQQAVFVGQSGDKKILNLGLGSYMTEVNPQQKIKKTKHIKSAKNKDAILER